eukprot:TRINITY_DN12084_c0_g2_i2.p5 TRINITY_DN12084_c0_g2~~TRINITY_DN12084_c0_g2_i2.p5  ORF type:complete len:128 (-),score=14.60 TRINITY_DN12084_c0_g2_i2:1317-1676(-)
MLKGLEGADGAGDRSMVADPDGNLQSGPTISRGEWLQRLNHFKQKMGVKTDWLDWQNANLEWCTQLLINGDVAVRTTGCSKKQDARDAAARAFLLQQMDQQCGAASADRAPNSCVRDPQ